MKRFAFTLFALFLTAGLAIEDAEARRLGGGRSTGIQRQAAPEKPATPPAAQQQAAPANPGAAAAKKPMSPWFGALAGLAAGLGLAYLFGEQLGTIVMIMLLALAAVAVVALLARAFLRPQQPQAAPRGLQFAHLGRETVAAPPPSQSGVALPDFRSQFTSRIPEGFNVDVFLREAKKSFLALQEANDRGDLGGIRDLVTDEMFEHLKRDVADRGAARQETDVVTLEAKLLEIVTESGTHWASIRFSGLIREEAGGAPQAFEEIWNLQKPEGGGAGWMLAGIQQTN